MGKSSKPNFPDPPSFQAFPTVEGDIRTLSDAGRGLVAGDFLNPDDPRLGFLNQLVTLNPEATQEAVGLASRDVIRTRDLAQQDILNQLEATNQLTSSTTANALTSLNEQFSADISDIATTFYLADVERSLANIGGLFELGLGTVQTSTQLGQEQQSQVNAFALQKFDRDFAIEAERFDRQQRGETAKAKALGPVFGAFDSGASGFNTGLDSALQRQQQFSGGFRGFGGGGAPGSTGLGPGGGAFFASQGNTLSASELQRQNLLNQRRFGGLA